MSIVAAYAVPHPPLIVPDVGRGQEKTIQKTIDAYEEVAHRIANFAPETIVVTSPHAPMFRDCFYISTGNELDGSMAQFNAPQASLHAEYDTELQAAIARLAENAGVPMCAYPPQDAEMDHATFVPLWFVRDYLPKCKVVRIGLSGLPSSENKKLGHAIAQAATELDRRVVLIASGDLSHKLTYDGPYGFAPEGPEFDRTCTAILDAAQFDELFAFDDGYLDKAAECGLGSFQIMAGALEGLQFSHQLLSYEGPFGVGYGVAAFEVEKSCAVAVQEDPAAEEAVAADGVDPYVALARASVEHYVRTRQRLPMPDGLPEEMLDRQAGVFVSLHEGGDLRGCIGTIAPVQSCIAEEIISNGISACSQDPRFSSVQPCELNTISYSVDVLEPPEPISSPDELDVKRYGVIVTQGARRGLLLPNLDGVNSVAEQLAIAKQKAGISPFDNDVELERFEVVRHNKGGEARFD